MLDIPVIPKPTKDYFKLNAREATRIARKVATQDGEFNWQIFKIWTEQYNQYSPRFRA